MRADNGLWFLLTDPVSTISPHQRYYAGCGMSTKEILEDFPELQPEDIQASLAFAADRERYIGELNAP